MSLIVKLGKTGKRMLKKLLPAPTFYLSPTRRIERVCTKKRICAMTFDDGPMNLPASPDRFGGRCLTDVLLDTLAEYGAKGTFDIVGDTSANYPDKAGKMGSASWGGIQYDHYPDIGKDGLGGAVHNESLVRRILQEGHQITNHGYRHIIFGKKPFVYGKRVFFGSFDRAYEDLNRLHSLLRDGYGYEITMGRPPHYVDKVEYGLTAYDVYNRAGYQYLAASYDGAGWLPSTHPDPEQALQAEVQAMVEPMRKALEQNPDFFCGQIIFQKDGYNMAKRTPVAFGLSKQLALLKEFGYEVVTVSQLMEECPFADVGRDDPDFEKFYELQKTRTVVYSDNRLRPDQPMTVGELAMLLCPREQAIARRMAHIAKHGQAYPYSGAMEWCREQAVLPVELQPDSLVTSLPEGYFEPTADYTRRGVYRAFRV